MFHIYMHCKFEWQNYIMGIDMFRYCNIHEISSRTCLIVYAYLHSCVYRQWIYHHHHHPSPIIYSRTYIWNCGLKMLCFMVVLVGGGGGVGEGSSHTHLMNKFKLVWYSKIIIGFNTNLKFNNVLNLAEYVLFIKATSCYHAHCYSPIQHVAVLFLYFYQI